MYIYIFLHPKEQINHLLTPCQGIFKIRHTLFVIYYDALLQCEWWYLVINWPSICVSEITHITFEKLSNKLSRSKVCWESLQDLPGSEWSAIFSKKSKKRFLWNQDFYFIYFLECLYPHQWMPHFFLNFTKSYKCS